MLSASCRKAYLLARTFTTIQTLPRESLGICLLILVSAAARSLQSEMAAPKTPPLPPAEVEVTTTSPTPGDVAVDVSVRREGANRGWPRRYKGEGKTFDDATTDVIKKIFDDPISGEFHRK